MLINLRNALMARKRLPYDAEVEYLESTGTQYINTGIKPGPNTRAEIVFAMTTFTANCGLFGARGAAMSNNLAYNLFIVNYGGQKQVRWDWSGNGVYKTTQAETSTVATYSLGVAGSTITRDGAFLLDVSAGKVAIDYPIYIFNFNNVGSPYSTGANAKFWSVKIYEGNVLVRDYIPVRKGAVGYLYDRVSGKLFGNAGTGDFVLGQDVVPVESIESHGTEYIDTGVVPTTTKTEITFSTPTPPSSGYMCGSFNANNNRYYPAAFSGSSTRYINLINAANTVISQYTNDGNVHTVVYNATGGACYFDGAAAGTLDTTTLTASNPIYLFCTSTSTGASGLVSGRIYSCKLYDANDTPVRSMLPVRVGTEGAMMDTLTRRIYRNAGTGAFTYGNDLKYPIPAE